MAQEWGYTNKNSGHCVQSCGQRQKKLLRKSSQTKIHNRVRLGSLFEKYQLSTCTIRNYSFYGKHCGTYFLHKVLYTTSHLLQTLVRVMSKFTLLNKLKDEMKFLNVDQIMGCLSIKSSFKSHIRRKWGDLRSRPLNPNSKPDLCVPTPPPV